MDEAASRRRFLLGAAGLVAGMGAARLAGARSRAAAEEGAGERLKKALIVNVPSEDVLARLKAAGFDGVEAGILEEAEAEKCRAGAEKLGMKIHSVLRGWAEFNSSDPGLVESTLELTRKALRAAAAYGADAVLLVPCRIGGMPMPRAWEFHIDFDPANGHIRTVTIGDNAPFQAYIEAHNHATDASRKAVEKLIPLAEELRVVIALENVWNNLWVEPRIFRHFVESFKSPWVKAYFDIGNHVKYAPPEKWILELGSLLVKCHVKDFLLDPDDAGGGGKFVNIREGSVRWPVVRAALERAGYRGWMTIEGGDLSLEEHSRRLDLIIAGK